MEQKFNRRPPVKGKRDENPVRERRSYARRSDSESERPRRPYTRRSDSDSESERPRRPYTRRSDSDSQSERPRRPYTRRSDSDSQSERPRRPYTRRSDSDSQSERPRRPYTRRSDSDSQSERPRRPYTRRSDSDSQSERPRRPYTRRSDSDSQSERPRRPYTRRSDSDSQSERPRRPYTRRSDSDRGYDRPRKRATAPTPSRETNPNVVRLNKFIANSGVCSRREADNYIQTGLITVNGVIVTELGSKVNINDDIRFNGERLKGEKKVYIIMNKPKDYVTTMSDPHADRTVMDLISTSKCKERVFPIGRLDKSTTGVLLFTNDGEMAEKLTHPSYQIKKIYHVFLDKNLIKQDFDAILKGIELEDGEIHADSLSYVDDDLAQVGIEIHSGKNRIIRRLFEHLGYNVRKLDRVFFAGLTKKNLRRGEWRYLTDPEVAMLQMGSFE